MNPPAERGCNERVSTRAGRSARAQRRPRPALRSPVPARRGGAPRQPFPSVPAPAPQPSPAERRRVLMAAAGLLALLLALPGAPSPGARWTLPPPSNVRHSVDVRHCQLTVRWDPPKPGINHTCALSYETVVWTDGKDDNSREYDVKRSRSVTVDLGKEIVFGVRTECDKIENVHGDLFNITLQQKGLPGTGAINISCIWHNEQYITCSWKAGVNATQNSYNLFYGYVDQPGVQQCTNFSRDRNNFRCTFSYAKSQGTSMLRIVFEGNSEDVRPVCVSGKKFPVKLHPPSIVNISKDSNGVFLKWSKPADRKNLVYGIEIKDTATNSLENDTSDDQTSKSIGLKPNTRHTLRVRVKPKENSESIWSDWSEEAIWDDRETSDNTFNILLYIFIPFCVAVLTIILLVYLKRIKLLILPKIPDPGQVLKKMFEDQSEELQKQSTYDPVKDEQIHSLMLLEPTGNEV
ncbi:interleukin-13 receptor subunit alpha-1-like [Tiliqua scincoides]|uniref:interleukin-13 receptor subunit alpha-1-like n=1 Tax=Tiliqua scincoides TaxID=71010 RepID=UPI003462141A